MADKAFTAIKNTISKFGLKAPWKMTGVASTPEYLTATPAATHWRTKTPGSNPDKPMVPAAETDHIYDIKYWPRDTKREMLLVGGTNKVHTVKYEIEIGKDYSFLQEGKAPPRAGDPHKWGPKVALLDVENNGYT